MRWGDAVADANDEYDRDFGTVYETYETPVNEHGIKTRYEYTTNDDGERIKVIKEIIIKEVTKRTHREVERRKHISKFGECAGKTSGPEPGITMIGDEVQLESTLAKKKDTADKDSTSMGIICRHCGAVGDHWTLKCPYKDRLQAAGKLGAGGNLDDSPTMSSSSPSRSDKYIPPSIRNKMEGGDSRGNRQGDDATVRVTNLSEDTKESDLHELFSHFGVVKRIYLAKDKHTQLTKGFAFVTYMRREDAARAIENLTGYGYDHLILHLEWAKPAGY